MSTPDHIDDDIRGYREALTEAEARLGAGHPEVAHRLVSLGDALRRANRDDEAAATYERGIGLLERALGPDDDAVVMAIDHLADLHDDHERFDEAEPLHRRALQATEARYGPVHAVVAG